MMLQTQINDSELQELSQHQAGMQTIFIRTPSTKPESMDTGVFSTHPRPSNERIKKRRTYLLTSSLLAAKMDRFHKLGLGSMTIGVEKSGRERGKAIQT
ncbi:hypothetical protein M8C21_031396 [Ambrosia artemisiifolia]|uniref:Uncharacterized protein n=1 Tax=Ambrosia artemisiifolia TaxID=4212 RepID=A0AAD5CI18_AMBAR|nr:hypothetical protein M8C21_031396 [Ambrosia artemisiifolia]